MNYQREIFTFASNLAGRHGKGSALEAVQKYGAKYGQGVGLQGSSYGIPTKGYNLEILLLPEIKAYVDQFLIFAEARPNWMFHIVKIGCGLAGYNEADIKPLFKEAPTNCNLPEGWRSV